MNIKSFAKKSLLMFLMLVLVAVPFLSLRSAAAIDDYDLSGNAETANITMSSVDLLELYLNQKLVAEEYEYLMKYSEMNVVYENALSATKHIETEYNFVSKELQIIAHPNIYVAKNGKIVKWIPQEVTVGLDTKQLAYAGGNYSATFYGVEKDDSTFADVKYALEICIADEDMNQLLNFAYNDLEDIKAEIAKGENDYSDALAAYELQTQNYEKYLAYQAALKKYNTYISDKKVYDKALEKYEQYLYDLEQYNKAVNEYKAYEAAVKVYNTDLAAYQKYLNDLKIFEENKIKYKEYLDKINVITEQLKVIEATKERLTDSRQIYATIKGPLVDKVLEEKKTLIDHFRVPEQIVIDAGNATDLVRKLLDEYFALKTDKEKYEYYINNFDSFKNGFSDLTKSLAFLYRNDKVNAALKDEMDDGDDRKYRILVGQLAIVAGKLNGKPINSIYVDREGKIVQDTELFDNSYVFEKDGKGDSIGSLLLVEQSTFLTVDQKPLAGGYPKEIAAPIAPTPVTKPIAPIEPPKPTEPIAVAHPGDAPAVVEEPEYVEKTDAPSSVPQPYVPDPLKKAVADAFDTGVLAKREALTEDYILLITDTISKKVFNIETVDVMFYVGSEEILCSVDRGDRVIYPGRTPTKASDKINQYVFDGWVDADGNSVNLNSIDSDICLYPHFSAVAIYYDVTFVVDGVEYPLSLKYGEMPTFDESNAVKADDSIYKYIFAGWDRPVEPVTGDVIYTALFDREYIMSVGGVGVEILENEDYFEAEIDGNLSLDLSAMIDKVVERAEETGFKKGISVSGANGSFELSFDTIEQMHSSGHTYIDCKVLSDGDYNRRFIVLIGNSDGESAAETFDVDVKLDCNLLDGYNYALYYFDSDINSKSSDASNSGVKKYLPVVLDGEHLVSVVKSGVEYYLSVENSVNVVDSEYGLSVDTNIACPGDTVRVNYDLPAGTVLERVYLLYPDGSEQDVFDDAFVMPPFAVTVVMDVKDLEYTVIFKVGENVLSRNVYKYGEEVVVPLPPDIVVIDGCTYEFAGWSKDIVPVTEDAVYDALLNEIEQPPVPDGGSVDGSDDSDYTLIYKLIMAAKVCIAMLAFVVLPALVISVVYIIIGRKTRLRNRKKEK